MIRRYYNEGAVVDGLVSGTSSVLGTTALAAVVFGGSVVAINVGERNLFKKTAKQWFSIVHPELPSPMKAKTLTKKEALQLIKESKAKYKCKDLDLVGRAGGKILKEKNETIAFSVWIEYRRDKTTKEIELVNFINPKYKKYKGQYCGTLAVLSGNCSDSIMALRTKMKTEIKKKDPRKKDMLDKINELSDEDDENKEEEW